jgi:hypothetical protein
MGAQSDAKRLEGEVAKERERMETTIEAIRQRLTPGQLIDETLHLSGDVGHDFVSSLKRTIVENPIPAVLLGVSLVWLLVARSGNRDSPLGEPTASVAAGPPGDNRAG